MYLKNTIQQERLMRSQIKAGIRNQYLEDIKSAQILQMTAKKAQKQAERETTRARSEYESLHDTIEENSATISKYRQDVVETHYEKTSLRQTVKEQDKELKSLRTKLAKYNGTTKNKQLEIENARTERAGIDADARTSERQQTDSGDCCSPRQQDELATRAQSFEGPGQDQLRESKG
jgi:chromosome segregation ATPase